MPSLFDTATTYMNDRMTKMFGEDFTHTPKVGSPSTVLGVFEVDEIQDRADNIEVIWFESLDVTIVKGDKITKGGDVYQVLDANPDVGGGTRITVKNDVGILSQ